MTRARRAATRGGKNRALERMGGEGRPRGKGPKSIKTLIERAEKTTAPVRLRR